MSFHNQQSQTITELLLLTKDSCTFSRTLYKWNLTVQTHFMYSFFNQPYYFNILKSMGISFSLVSSIPLYGCSTMFLFIHVLMVVWVVSIWAIANKADINIHGPECVWAYDFIFPGQIECST